MSSALTLRRLAFVWAPVAAAMLIVAGYFLDPDIGAKGREMAREYAENPGLIQASALSFHFAFAVLIIPTLMLIGATRARGAWLGNVALLFAVLGMTTLPGFLLTDFYDVAIYGELGGDAWTTVDERLQELPAAMVLMLSGFFGFLLALPTALLAASRAGLLPAWPAVVAVIGGLASQPLPGGTGLLVWAAALVAISYALRGTTELHDSREVSALPAVA